MKRVSALATVFDAALVEVDTLPRSANLKRSPGRDIELGDSSSPTVTRAGRTTARLTPSLPGLGGFAYAGVAALISSHRLNPDRSPGR